VRWEKLRRSFKNVDFWGAIGKGKNALAFPSPSQCPCSASGFIDAKQ
jgi:hypothetical protein